MATLITQQEFIDLSLNQGNVDLDLIKLNIILIAELEYIKPFLSVDLYNKIVSENNSQVFTGGVPTEPVGETRQRNQILLDDFLKPALAFFVKSKFVLENGIRTTNAGSMVNESEVARAATRGERSDQIEEAKLNGKTFLGEAKEFIDDNLDDFPDFDANTSVKTGKLRGGIII